MRIVQVGAVIDDQILDGGEHFIDGFHSYVRDDARILDHVSKAVLHQLRMAHFT